MTFFDWDGQVATLTTGCYRITNQHSGANSPRASQGGRKMKAEKQTDALREAFHQRMHANNMYGLWELASQMTPQPQPKMIAHMWQWSTLEPIITESTSAVPVGDERRALQLFNLGGRWATTNNLIAAVQVLLPGEVARAHRHTPTAIRFIIEGNGAYTAVDGERVYMAPGDLILTPSWSWHDRNETKTHRVDGWVGHPADRFP
jgi:gentisate 1,2-dioxygenase